MISTLKWIVLNKRMSFSRKTYKLSVFLLLSLANYFRRGSRCTIVCAIYEHQPLYYKKLLRRIELLMKKGYIVQLKLSLSERQLLLLDLESEKLLIQLINQLNQQKEWRWI